MNSEPSSSIDKKALRASKRELRQHLGADEQHSTAKTVTETALLQSFFPLGNDIAIYMSANGEVDTGILLETLLELGKNCYLPVMLDATTTLEFRQYLPDQPLIRNSFGLHEPGPNAPKIAPQLLSTVFMPLVAFDDKGNRLGMGKGYYDRTFAFKMKSANETAKSPASPVLIGLAHECQKVESLEAATWDVPLKGIITGRKMYQCL